MSNDTIPDRANASTTTASFYNLIRTVISGDWYPRDSSCAPGDLVASLGSASYRWKRLFEASGGFTPGTIKWRMSYNGLVLPSEGWMLCDGRQVTKTAYDAEHGAGHWDSYIIASPLDSKFLPNLASGRYLTGAASVAQDGSVALTRVGNPGSTLNLNHNHNWFIGGPANTHDETFNSSGSAYALNSPGAGNKTVNHYSLVVGAGTQVHGGGNQTLYTDKKLSAAQDIRPTSIQVLFYMRVI